MRKIIKNLYLIVTIIQPTLLFPHSQKSNKPGMIILLNGTSSAGKTTLSQALHAIYENYEVAHIDNYTRRHNHGSFKTKSHGFYTEIKDVALAGQNILDPGNPPVLMFDGTFDNNSNWTWNCQSNIPQKYLSSNCTGDEINNTVGQTW